VDNFLQATNKFTNSVGIMSTVHTFKNPNYPGYTISEDSPKIDPESLENGMYARNKRQSEIKLIDEAQNYSLSTLMIYCNHIIGANMNGNQLLNGYPLGICGPDFRTLTKEKLESPTTLSIFNEGNNRYNVVDLSTLASVISIAISRKLKGDLIIGNPQVLSAKEYYAHSAAAFDLIADHSQLHNYYERINNYQGNVEDIQPESMNRSWVLNLQKMCRLLKLSDNQWKERIILSMKQSAKVPIDERSQLILRMNMR
jgi:nucleoside-diphosphate-sugar epimerase